MNKSRYIKVPNIPTDKVTDVIVDYRINKTSEENLVKMGINVIKTVKLNNLYQAVDGHPDMQIHHLGDNLFVCEKTLLSYYQKLLPDANIIPGVFDLKKQYPEDIAYNACRIGDFLFHNLKFTDYQILEYYKTKGVKLINVKQGYTKCSVCIINENAIITSDIKIAEIAEKNGINALFYNNKQILLNGLDYGFIGGICGLIDKNNLVINGDVRLLGNYDRLLFFCQKYNVKIISLNNLMPEDIGSILPIKQLWCYNSSKGELWWQIMKWNFWTEIMKIKNI